MDFFVGVTDNDWYRFLAEREPDEVNFWRPSPTTFKAIPPGAPFLFKLHAPRNYIAGGGFFVRYSELPLSLAWKVFGFKNGADNYSTFYNRIEQYKRSKNRRSEIGCIILTEPFFFEEDDWIPIPEDWSANIVQGKTYSTEDSIGQRLWDQVQVRLEAMNKPGEQLQLMVTEGQPQYGEESLVRRRLGQGAFRVLVTEAYQRRCAVTGEKVLPALEASHIKPYAESGPHQVDNGLLLRADLHRLFDDGYVTVTPDHRLEVSRRIKEEFNNGEDYYQLQGRSLATLPSNQMERPSREFVEWHNEHVFAG